MAIAIMIGDCLQSLRELPGNSIQTCITSPPYFGLRDYGADGQIGLEETTEEYIAKLVAVFAEVRRVMRDNGTLWLNIGDSFCDTTIHGFKRKDLMMIPARLAMALQADGWWLRSEIIWHKPNAMPDSAKDRPGVDHEKVFLLSKSERYFYDAEAVKVPSAGTGGGNFSAKTQAGRRSVIGGGQVKERQPDTGFRNLRTVWSFPTQPYRGAHFAPMPSALAETCIRAATPEVGYCPHCGMPWRRIMIDTGLERLDFRGSDFVAGKTGGRPGGDRTSTAPRTHKVSTGWQQSCSCPAHQPIPAVVLDPFGGSGTTGLVAGALGRHTVLCELNPAYAELARQRLVDGLGMYAQVEMLPETDIRIAA